MTDRNGIYWKYKKDVYTQQRVCNPPTGQQPNNARFAVWHFSKKYTVLKFLNGTGWRTDGRFDRGLATEFDFWCNVQPFTRTRTLSETVRNELLEGHRTDSLISVTYDPFINNSQNVDYEGDFPDEPIYEDGIFLYNSDARVNVGVTTFDQQSYKFGDLIIYDGQYYQVVHSDFTNGGDEDLQGRKGRLGHAVMAYFDDVHHERNATNDYKEQIGERFNVTNY